MRLISIVILLFLLPFHSLAQPLDTADATRAKNLLFVTPLEDTILYSAPPSGFFNRKGSVLGSVSPSQTYAVLGVRRQQSGIGNLEVWFNVAPLDANGVPIEAKAGWVRFGNTRQPEIFSLSATKPDAGSDGLATRSITISPQVFLEK